MQDASSPRRDTLCEEFSLLNALLARADPTARPPARGGNGWRTAHAEQKHADPLHPRHEDRLGRRIEVTGFDMREPVGLARADGTQPFQSEAFRFLEDTVIPDDECILARRFEGGKARIGLLPKEVGNQASRPTGRAQEIREAFGAGRGVTGRGEVATEFAEEQTMGTVTPAENRVEGGDEGLDETPIEVSIEREEEGKEKDGQPSIEGGCHLWGRLDSGGEDGIIEHEKPPVIGIENRQVTMLAEEVGSCHGHPANSGMTHVSSNT